MDAARKVADMRPIEPLTARVFAFCSKHTPAQLSINDGTSSTRSTPRGLKSAEGANGIC